MALPTKTQVDSLYLTSKAYRTMLNATPGPITLNSTGQRTARTPLSGEVVLDSTLNTFWRGDGLTAGGVAHPIGYNAKQLQGLNIIIPRHQHLGSAIQRAWQGGTTKIPAGFIVANSISSSGASGATAQIGYVFAGKLQAYTGVGTTNNWSPPNYGVGGCISPTLLAYLSENSDNATFAPQRGTIWNTANLSYGLLIPLRNDAGVGSGITAKDSALMIRACLQQCKRHNIDAILIIDPPQINQTTGVILDNTAGGATSWDAYYQNALRIAAVEGASVVDTWAYFKALYDAGVDLRPFFADGTHWSDLGHAVGAELVFQCALQPVQSTPNMWGSSGYGDAYIHAVSAYVSQSGITSTTTVAGLTTAKTARQVQTNEGTVEAFTLAAGNTVKFRCPGNAVGVVFTMINAAANVGTASLSYNGSSMGTGFGASLSIVREYSRYVSMITLAGAQNLKSGDLTITAVGGQIQITGVSFITPIMAGFNPRPANTVEVGAWSDVTFTGGNLARQSSTIADTLTFTWFGTTLTVGFEQGQHEGAFSYNTDAAGATTQDCYLLAAAKVVYLTVASGLAEAWHSTVFTITAKNASSDNQKTLLGQFQASSYLPDPQFKDISLFVGDTIQLPDYWSRADVLRVITGAAGTTYIDKWVPGQSAIALTGSAGDRALVRLSR